MAQDNQPSLVLSGPCYHRNGAPVQNDSSIVPCGNGPIQTICCATNRQNKPGGRAEDGLTQDECLPNGQ